jgi:hypothetical protein
VCYLRWRNQVKRMGWLIRLALCWQSILWWWIHKTWLALIRVQRHLDYGNAYLFNINFRENLSALWKMLRLKNQFPTKEQSHGILEIASTSDFWFIILETFINHSTLKADTLPPIPTETEVETVSNSQVLIQSAIFIHFGIQFFMNTPMT